MQNNMEIYSKLENPPTWALKTIGGGRLKGMTDISPQWRYQALTDVFGPCGIGWKYQIKKLWTEETGKERLCFAEIDLWYKYEEKWSEPIPGIGGNKIIATESSGERANDECYKSAVTDALSVACKMIGVGAKIYANGNESKYSLLKDESETVMTQEQLSEKQKKISKELNEIDRIFGIDTIAKIHNESNAQQDYYATGVLQKVSTKTGKGKNGKDYTMYGLMINDIWYKTFDDKLYDKAKSFQDCVVGVKIDERKLVCDIKVIDQ